MTNNHECTGPTKAAEGMHPDLEWLARNVSEWRYEIMTHIEKDDDYPSGYCYSRIEDLNTFTRNQWLQARKDLGLVMTEAEERDYVPVQDSRSRLKDPQEVVATQNCRCAKVELPEGVEAYSQYYKDVSHLDRIDVYRTVDLFGCEKHGHPISHAAKKLLLTGCRTGGKDVETDVREAIDTLNRWLQMREEDKASELRSGKLEQ